MVFLEENELVILYFTLEANAGNIVLLLRIFTFLRRQTVLLTNANSFVQTLLSTTLRDRSCNKAQSSQSDNDNNDNNNALGVILFATALVWRNWRRSRSAAGWG